MKNKLARSCERARRDLQPRWRMLDGAQQRDTEQSWRKKPCVSLSAAPAVTATQPCCLTTGAACSILSSCFQFATFPTLTKPTLSPPPSQVQLASVPSSEVWSQPHQACGLQAANLSEVQSLPCGPQAQGWEQLPAVASL